MQTAFASFLCFYLSFVKIIFIKFITHVIITVFIQYLSQIKEPLHFLQSMKFGGETWTLNLMLNTCHTASISAPKNSEQVHQIKSGFLLVFPKSIEVMYSIFVLCGF